MAGSMVSGVRRDHFGRKAGSRKGCIGEVEVRLVMSDQWKMVEGGRLGLEGVCKEEGGYGDAEEDAVVSEDGEAVGLEIFHEPADGEGGGDGGGDDAGDEGNGAVGVPHEHGAAEPLIVGGSGAFDAPGGFFGGGGGEGEDAEKEGIFYGGFDGKADDEAAADGHEGAGGAGPHGDALKDADEEGGLPIELEDVPAVAAGWISFAPVDGPENGKSTGDPCEDDGPETEEFFLDEIIEEEAEDGGGDESDEDGDGEFEAFGVLAEDTFDHSEDVFVIESEDGEDGSTLDADGEAIGGEFPGFSGGADVHEALGDDQVAGGGDGKVFGNAFDDAEEDCLPEFHKVKFPADVGAGFSGRQGPRGGGGNGGGGGWLKVMEVSWSNGERDS